jgi:hypothetical protein
MKRRLLILLSACGILLAHAQQIIDLHSGKLNEKVTSTVPIRDVEELEDGYKITYTFKKAMIQQDRLFPGTMFWKIAGFGMNQTSGDPCTLVRNDLIAIPFGCRVKIEVVDSVYNDFNYELTPARQPLSDSSDEVYTKQNVLAIKPYDGFRPTTVVSQSEIQSYRGHSLVQAVVSPIQYNYNTKTIRAYTSITYKVSFMPDAEASKVVPMPLSREDNFLANNAIGGGQKVTNRAGGNTAQSDVRDYLILSTNTYSAAANRFAEWKRLMGFNVHIVLRDDWTSASVKSEVTNAYANFPALYYLLIIGDHDDVPAQQSSLLDIAHITDFHYGCMDNDYIPEIYCGRLSVSTSDEALNVVDKIIGYERTPPTNTAFYNNGLHCAYFQDNDSNTYEDCRFTRTSEDVRTYVMTKGKTLQRVYTTPSDITPLYWSTTYSDGGAIPDELKKPGFAWNGDYTDINNAINNGVFYVLHRDHGLVNRWGDPQYTQQHISNLSNGNLLPVVFSMNCLTGKFDQYCFAETFLRKTNGGCVGIYGATQTSFVGYNDALTSGMFDAIWPNPGLYINIPNYNNTFSTTPTPTYTLGQILGQGMVRMAQTFGWTVTETKYSQEIFHCFGDPSMKIYTQMPTAFTGVSVVRNNSSVSVTLGANEMARITVYNPVSNEVQSFIGNSVTVTTSNPIESIVCISDHNRIPFIKGPDIMYIQNTNIAGTLNETHDVIKVGNHVTTNVNTGDVTTSNANITFKALEVLLDSGTSISVGSTLKTINP